MFKQRLKQWLRIKLLNLLREDIEGISKQYKRDTEEIFEQYKREREGIQARLDETVSMLCEGKENQRGRILTLEENMRANNKYIQEIRQNADVIDPYSIIDYGQFENNFRGSRELIKERQKEYLPYFENRKRILDLGCGRGEFLELMRESGISAVGVDLYQPFVDQCKQQGYEVYCEDALVYLSECEPVDGIFLGQLAEHLPIVKLIQLCRIAYEKLLPGGCIIIETPNPTSLAIYSHAFYADPSHKKPVHPETLRYYLFIAGFRKIEILYTEGSKLPTQIPKLESELIGNLDAFNESMEEVSKQLFGSRDYAAIAFK